MTGTPRHGRIDARPVDRLPIALRAYATLDTKSDERAKAKTRSTKKSHSSKWTLVFDTETTVDASQQLRFGAYQLRNSHELDEAGIFFERASLTDREFDRLERYARENHLAFRSRSEFVEEVVYKRAYDLRATIVGFNLPFDISRLAIEHGSARGKSMRGGFTFKLSPKRWRPPIQIRHLNARASLIQFAHPPRPRNSPSQTKRKISPPNRRGHFVDVKTIAAALLSRSFDLKGLAQFLNTTAQKADSGGHGRALNERYIGYALQDIQATWECFEALRERYSVHGLKNTPLGKILSEASLGKAYLTQMGIRPFSEVQPEFPPEMTGRILSAYFGGRSEVRIRREIREILYCDFLSMYPTVCTLMGLGRFVIAEGMNFRDATDEVREFVNSIALDKLQRPEFWRELTTIVRVSPQADILPVRAKYDGTMQTIGLNYLSCETSLWFTLADVIAAKLLGGKTPEILEAITFTPKAVQAGLKRAAIAGNSEFIIDPNHDDFFRRLIDLRTSIKSRLKQFFGPNRAALKSDQLAMKILANSTSYGIFVEMNVAELDKPATLKCFGSGDNPITTESKKLEEPGRYFDPLLATLITGAARLMLGIAERLCGENELDWAFCDTDSLAIAKPEGMLSVEFLGRAQSICDWFAPLNPYEKKGSIFKIEDANYSISENCGDSKFKQLYCICISAKRYALFNLGPHGEIIIRKASAHGLGQYLPPYGPDDAPPGIPAPSIGLGEIGVERWQYDLWHEIIRAVLEGHPDQVDLSYHEALSNPAASRYGASTPALLRWFKKHNAARDYIDQVKPFNFLVSFQARPQFELSPEEQWAKPARGRPRKTNRPKPIAAFNRDVAKAAKIAFDRNTGASIPAQDLKTYAEALAQYHLRPESKFLNGAPFDRGRTERRHVLASDTLRIGKESNRWEEQYYLGGNEDADIEYGPTPEVLSNHFCKLKELVGTLGERETARRMQISRGTLRRIVSHDPQTLSARMLRQISVRMSQTF